MSEHVDWQIQQGDVCMERVESIPPEAIKIARTPRGYVLAEGETTGHAHIIQDDVELYEKDGVLYVRTMEPAHLVHEEHAPLIVAQGIWKVMMVQEFCPFEEESRLVED